MEVAGVVGAAAPGASGVPVDVRVVPLPLPSVVTGTAAVAVADGTLADGFALLGVPLGMPSGGTVGDGDDELSPPSRTGTWADGAGR